jgi:hypothetical protein
MENGSNHLGWRLGKKVRERGDEQRLSKSMRVVVVVDISHFLQLCRKVWGKECSS